MEPPQARALARSRHGRQRNRFDELVIEHVERVAGRVAPEYRAVALLHDLLEQTTTTVRDLRSLGAHPAELAVLALLTHRPDETYEAYVRRIAGAPGPHGRAARSIKLADLDDHLGHDPIPPGAPPYSWARAQVLAAEERELADRRRRRQGRRRAAQATQIAKPAA